MALNCQQKCTPDSKLVENQQITHPVSIIIGCRNCRKERQSTKAHQKMQKNSREIEKKEKKMEEKKQTNT